MTITVNVGTGFLRFEATDLHTAIKMLRAAQRRGHRAVVTWPLLPCPTAHENGPRTRPQVTGG